MFFQGRGQLDPKEDQRLESRGFRLVNIATEEILVGVFWKLFKEVSTSTHGLIEPCKRPLIRLIESLQKVSVPHEMEKSILGHINQINADIKRIPFKCEREADRDN